MFVGGVKVMQEVVLGSRQRTTAGCGHLAVFLAVGHCFPFSCWSAQTTSVFQRPPLGKEGPPTASSLGPVLFAPVPVDASLLSYVCADEFQWGLYQVSRQVASRPGRAVSLCQGQTAHHIPHQAPVRNRGICLTFVVPGQSGPKAGQALPCLPCIPCVTHMRICVLPSGTGQFRTAHMGLGRPTGARQGLPHSCGVMAFEVASETIFFAITNTAPVPQSRGSAFFLFEGPNPAPAPPHLARPGANSRPLSVNRQAPLIHSQSTNTGDSLF